MEFIAVALLIICGIIIYFYFIKGNHDDWVEGRQKEDERKLNKSKEIIDNIYIKPSYSKNNRIKKEADDKIQRSYGKTKTRGVFRKRRSQLEIVNQSGYRAVSLLNNEEKVCFYAINDALDHDTHFLFIQVSMGEVIKPYKKFGGYVTNNKRFDFLVTDRQFNPALVVEYNGTGHFQNNWKERDQVKEIACEKAGLPFFVITYNEDKSILVSKIRSLLYGDRDSIH